MTDYKPAKPISDSLKDAIESVMEARKKIGEYSHEGNTTKVYKLSGEHDEGDPYHVKLFKNGKHYEPADYFTNDEEDAHGTAKHMVKESASYGYSPKNPKIDIHVNGAYHSSTNWSKNTKDAVENFKNQFPEHRNSNVKASLAK